MEKRAQAFIELHHFLTDFLGERKKSTYQNKYQQLDKAIDESFSYNGWFTRPYVLKALQGLTFMLDSTSLQKFIADIKEPKVPKTVAIIMAGNIPLVGFHDFLCVLLSGNKILIKPSTDDKILLTFFADLLIEIEPTLKEKIIFSEGRLTDFDAVIATGSNNSSLYFEKYFSKYPHIIRKNRTSVAVLSCNETAEELSLLGNDIFDYFGLGCRNVSKLYVPKGYNFNLFYESIFGFADVVQNKKYANNHEYNRAIYLLNQEKFLDNNFLLIKQSDKLHSPISTLFYEEYENLSDVSEKIKQQHNELQCVVSNENLGVSSFSFGKTQSPTLFDFADNVNTLHFLNNLV